jgi:hypothetical protein
METILRQQESPDVSIEQRRSSELVKRIRKLRWMGLEGEARRMQVQLALSGGARADSVLAAPPETD